VEDSGVGGIGREVEVDDARRGGGTDGGWWDALSLRGDVRGSRLCGRGEREDGRRLRDGERLVRETGKGLVEQGKM
jgi:hypothetical protein